MVLALSIYAILLATDTLSDMEPADGRQTEDLLFCKITDH